MNFNEIYSLVLREPSKQMDDFTLIAEIEKRPDLWGNPNKKSKVRIDLWKDVAKSVGTNVRACKSKWGKLRRFYHMEEKNTQQRIEQLINSGKYNHKQNYNSRWIYFERMKFLSEIPADNKFGENSDSDEGSNFSDTENTDDDVEIEVLIEDSLSETENDNETKNYDKPHTQTYGSFDMLPKSINVSTNTESNKNTMSNGDMPPRSTSVAGTSKEVNKNAKFNYDMLPGCISVSTNQEVNTKNDNRPKDNAELKKKGNIFVRQDLQTNACIVDKQNTSVLQGGRNCTITSNLLPSLEQNLPHSNNEASNPPSKCPVAPMAPTTAHTNENTINNNISNNNESVKSVQFSNAEIVQIKEEPADVEEINNANEEQELMKSSRSKILNTSINLVPDRCSERYTIANIKEEPLDIKLETISLCSNEECDDSDKDKEMGNKYDFEAEVLRQIQVKDLPETVIEPNSTDNCLSDQESADDVATSACEFVRGSYKHVKFLQDLAKEEQELMKSTTQDIERSNEYLQSDDSDYNFLLSYLPQMKSMNKKQNLQFRAKVADLTFKILSNNDASVSRTSSSKSCIS